MDMDVIVLKPLDSLSNTMGSEILANGEIRLNGAIMAFNKSRSVIEATQFHCLVVWRVLARSKDAALCKP
jgi:hypothetical protein